MKGRKPTPTAIKRLLGNAGKRPLPVGEPQPEPAIPTCPRHLNGEAKKEWRRLTRELGEVGMLTRLDRGVLASYCSAWGRLVDAETALREHGCIVKSPSGFPIQNPYLCVSNKAIELLTKIGAELGLSPSSRSRIRITPARKLDAFDEFLNGPNLKITLA